MKILIIGGGGREHAMAWAISKSPQLDKLFIAPGNAGTAELGTNVPIGVEDFEGIRKLVIEEGIELVLVGPEAIRRLQVRFSKQVWPGDVLTATATVKGTREENGEKVADLDITVVNQDGVQSIVGEATAVVA